MYCYDYSNLKRICQTENGKEVVEQFRKFYDVRFKDKPIPVINYSFIKRYYQDRNRNEHQDIYFERRERLSLLQVLAISNDKYLEPLEEVLSAICDEFCWVLPAHNLIKDQNVFDYTIVDLFSSGTALALAETLYVLKDKLSADIKKRIMISLEDKIVKNYESRVFNFDALKNNWASVCAAGVGITYLYVFPERFPRIEDRLMRSFENYLVSIDDEGYCAEGMGYWGYGFGHFCIFFDVYTKLLNKWHPLLDTKKVRNTLGYFKNANMGDNVYLPFADGGERKSSLDMSSLYAIKNLFPDEFVLNDEFNLYPKYPIAVRTLVGVDAYGVEKNQVYGTHYYEKAQVFIHKNKNYSFAAKGGCNHEPHGHCCVGVFQIVKGGKRLISDLGAGEYTYGYFNVCDDSEKGRYGSKIFVCSSFSHSVPILNGNPQPYNLSGDNAVVLSRTDDCFKMDISATYKEKPERFEVAYKVSEDSVAVTYDVVGVEKEVTFRFVSDYRPVEKDGRVVIEEMTITSEQGIVPRLSSKDYAGHNGDTERAYIVDYTVKTDGIVYAEFTFKF